MICFEHAAYLSSKRKHWNHMSNHRVRLFRLNMVGEIHKESLSLKVKVQV